MLNGIFAAMVTPFKDDLNVDEESIKWLIEYLERNNVNGAFVVSTTGEFAHLTKEEKIKIVKTAIESAKENFQILAGATDLTTHGVIELMKVYKDLGVKTVVVAPPFYYKIKNDELLNHYMTISSKIDTSLVLYNIPSLTGVNIPINMIKRLVLEKNNVIGIKATVDDMNYIKDIIIEIKSIRNDFSVFSGTDLLFVPTLMLGGDGAILASANYLPGLLSNIFKAYMDKDFMLVMKLYKYLIEFISAIDKLGLSIPTITKLILNMLNPQIKPFVRPPLTAATNDQNKMLNEIFQKFKAIFQFEKI
ncbi:MAG: dihydrodipicolinate synthase family protein [Thermoprotei archaeon]